ENLRSLGMPEATIRDIIIADVEQLFVKRRRELASQQDSEWWRSQPSQAHQSNQLAQAFALDEERTALLNKLLGEDWKKTRLDQQPDPVPLTGPILSGLPEDVKTNVQNIALRSTDRVRDYIMQMQEAGQQVNQLELAKLREQTREELAKVLNPQQLEEFLIRNSFNATQLRRQVEGLEVTPDEFRAIFRRVDQIERDLQLRYSADDPESQRRRAALELERQAAIREAVGAERYGTYVMLHDPVYQESLATVEKAGASPEAAVSLYEITRATADELARIRDDNTLTAGQKQEQMREVQAEQQRARTLVLGEEASASTPFVPPNEPPLRSHVKNPGETLGELAFRYGVRIPEIRDANPGVDVNRVAPGTVLNIPLPTQPRLPPLPLPPGAR
ncbi:MAG TPA: LysM domain-containing protein, partial [Candidatus Acidoferrum sp.]|nr:LysM domain-containing protein [Candidatus Acidoferrum sp.]